MAFDLTQFRTDFPEFADSTKYPDSLVTFWSGIGVARMNPRRWGSLYDQGLELFTAHSISIARADQDQAAMGNTPGNSSGVIASQGAGPLSFSVDTKTSEVKDAQSFNLTTYGKEFYQLAMLVGIGGAQL
jgi:hypothetical protein